MFCMVTREKKTSRVDIDVVKENILPQKMAVIGTRAVPQGIVLKVGKTKEI